VAFWGFGLDLKGSNPPDLPGLLNDLWLWSGSDWIPAGLTLTQVTTGGTTTSTADFVPIQTTIISARHPGITLGSVSCR